MKKLIVFSVILVLLTGVAFGQASFSAWGRAVIVPLRYDGAAEEAQAGTHVQWGTVPNFAANFTYAGDQFGFVSNFDFAAVDRDGNLYTYWQPNDMIKLYAGWARVDELRGPDTVDSFHRYMGGGHDVVDFVFHRFSTADGWAEAGASGPGFVLAITPIDGLFIGASAVTGGGKVPWAGSWQKAEDVYKNGLYAAGYTIDGIGLFRVGYFGSSSFNDDKDAIIQAAFKLTAVEGLGLDVGFSYCIDEDLKEDTNPMMIALVAGYTAGAFSVDLSADAMLGGDKKAGEDGMVKIFGIVTPSYSMDFGTIGGSFLFKTTLDADDSTALGGALWLSKGFGGGTLKVGAAVEVPAGKDSKINFALPIELTYSL